eukprot:ctg_174.g115
MDLLPAYSRQPRLAVGAVRRCFSRRGDVRGHLAKQRGHPPKLYRGVGARRRPHSHTAPHVHCHQRVRKRLDRWHQEHATGVARPPHKIWATRHRVCKRHRPRGSTQPVRPIGQSQKPGAAAGAPTVATRGRRVRSLLRLPERRVLPSGGFAATHRCYCARRLQYGLRYGFLSGLLRQMGDPRT